MWTSLCKTIPRNLDIMPSSFRLAIMRFVSYFIYYSGIYCAFNQSRGQRGVTILTYHRILETAKEYNFSPSVASATTENFEKQLNYLVENFQIISLADYVKAIHSKADPPAKAVIITFDDGYKEVYKYVYPAVVKFDVPAHIFLSTGYVGNNKIFWWDKLAYMLKKITETTGTTFKPKFRDNASEEEAEQFTEKVQHIYGIKIPEELARDAILTWDEIRDMAHNGITFGAHTVSHSRLASLPKGKQEEEIINSRIEIEQKINKTITDKTFKCTTFSYPYGSFQDFSEETIQILKDNKFTCATTTMYGLNRLDNIHDLYKLRRIGISVSDDMIVFKVKLSGIVSILHVLSKALKVVFRCS